MRIAIPVDEKSIKTSVCQSFGRHRISSFMIPTQRKQIYR